MENAFNILVIEIKYIPNLSVRGTYMVYGYTGLLDIWDERRLGENCGKILVIFIHFDLSITLECGMPVSMYIPWLGVLYTHDIVNFKSHAQNIVNFKSHTQNIVHFPILSLTRMISYIFPFLVSHAWYCKRSYSWSNTHDIVIFLFLVSHAWCRAFSYYQSLTHDIVHLSILSLTRMISCIFLFSVWHA